LLRVAVGVTELEIIRVVEVVLVVFVHRQAQAVAVLLLNLLKASLLAQVTQ
jgi:hypothetical protein